MNLPCDAVIVLMVITCVSIYVISYCISYCIRTYKLLQVCNPVHVSYYIISASIYEHVLYMHAVVCLCGQVIVYILSGVTLM